MSRYFHISNGLRGCYMPDSAYTLRADTRRELKAALEEEAESLRSAGYHGLGKARIAWLAAAVWRDKRASLPYCVPCSLERGSADYGLFAAPSSRADWLAEQEES